MEFELAGVKVLVGSGVIFTRMCCCLMLTDFNEVTVTSCQDL